MDGRQAIFHQKPGWQRTSGKAKWVAVEARRRR